MANLNDADVMEIDSETAGDPMIIDSEELASTHFLAKLHLLQSQLKFELNDEPNFAKVPPYLL